MIIKYKSSSFMINLILQCSDISRPEKQSGPTDNLLLTLEKSHHLTLYLPDDELTNS